MKSRKFRNGTKKWKQSGHKTCEWFRKQYGTSGMSKWQKNGSDAPYFYLTGNPWDV